MVGLAHHLQTKIFLSTILIDIDKSALLNQSKKSKIHYSCLSGETDLSKDVKIIIEAHQT